MIWSNRSYKARKEKIILGRGLDGEPLIKLNAPKGTEISEGINYEYTIKKAEEEVYIEKERDNKIFLLLNFEGNVDTGIANLYVEDRNEYDIEMLDYRREFGVNNFNLQKVVIIEIKYPCPICFRIEYFNETIDDEYIIVIREKVYCFKSDRKDLIEEVDWLALY